MKLKRRGVGLSGFSVGRPDFDTPKYIKEAIKKVIDKGLVHYTSSAGVLEPKKAVCYHLQKDYRINIDPEEVIITAGALGQAKLTILPFKLN